MSKHLLSRGRIFLSITSALLFLAVVIPNSLQKTTAAVQIASFILSLGVIKAKFISKNLLLMFAMSLVVTVVYILIGLHNGAPIISVYQVVIIYIASPLMWIFISFGLLSTIGKERLVRVFSFLGILCTISVGIYFFLYLRYGPDAVDFFTDHSNINLNDGYAAAVLHVYGSLIFLAGGFFAAPEKVKSKWHRILLLTTIFIAAVTSGRAALILAVPIGLAVNLAFRTENHSARGSHTARRIISISILFLTLVIGVFLITLLTSIDLGNIYTQFINKMAAGGGEARVDQMAALLNGIYGNNGLGSGHGVGVDYVRNTDFPWRYEAIWVATVFRVGIIGALIYSAPFFIYIAKIIKKSAKRGLSSTDKFYFGSFLCVFIASNTNPYIEAVSFQWMYVIPLAIFFGELSYNKLAVPRHNNPAS